MSQDNQPVHRRTSARVTLIVAVVVSLALAGYAASVSGIFSASSESSESSSAASDHGATGSGDEPEESPSPSPRPTPRPVLEAAEAGGAQAPSTDGLTTALGEILTDETLGEHVGASVRELDADEPAYGQDGQDGYVPASTMKILTGVSVLETLGPAHRFETTVRYEPPAGPDAPATLTLVGGGDPLLSSAEARDDRPAHPRRATLEELAARTTEALAAEQVDRVRLAFDDELFTETESPDWEDQYVPTGVVAPLSSLWVDQAKTDWPSRSPRAQNPGLDAAERFAAELERRDITVTADPARDTAHADAEQLAGVASARVGELVEHAMLTSDNDAAEVLGRHVAVARGEPATFAGMSTAMTDVLDELGVDLDGTRIDDASGLARSNRLTPDVLTAALAVAAAPDRPELRAVLSGLPVAGYNGTLGERFVYSATDGSGYVRAKTGTLTGVASLAGLVTTADGDVLAFALLADQVDATDPRPALDQAAAALAGCGCR